MSLLALGDSTLGGGLASSLGIATVNRVYYVKRKKRPKMKMTRIQG